jgi:gentisate 1,2-dioxygenase
LKHNFIDLPDPPPLIHFSLEPVLDQASHPLIRCTPYENTYWRPFLIRRETWQDALRDVAAQAADAFGRREIMVRHPEADPHVGGMAPGIEIKFGTLAPGASIAPSRTNAAQFYMLLQGQAQARIGQSARFTLGFRDSWVVPAMQPWTLVNTGADTVWYITYSNAALLKRLEVYYEEAFSPAAGEPSPAAEAGGTPRARDLAGPGHVLNDTGAKLLPYEYLVDVDPVQSRPVQWRWEEVKPYLPGFHRFKDDYNGRLLWALYNPATERRNGATSCFFATISCSPPGRTGKSHKHVSAAVNFILDGEGYSLVDGERMDWVAGDIMLSAPGWLPHAHFIGGQVTSILTIQDHPLHIAMESLIWQENLPAGPIMNIGAESGFNTNLAETGA